MSPTAREKPGWLFDAADKQWPAWVVQLTAGTDREGSHYMLDTTDGTVTRYCAGGRFEYPPTYAPDDARSWRDRECNPETVTLRDWLKQWREMYRQMTVLTVPADPFSYGSVDPCFGALEAEPGSYCFEQIDVSQFTFDSLQFFSSIFRLAETVLRNHVFEGVAKDLY